MLQLAIMSKKLVNSPEHAVDEAHSGLVAANPGLRLLAGHRVIVRADTEDVVNEGKVESPSLSPLYSSPFPRTISFLFVVHAQ